MSFQVTISGSPKTPWVYSGVHGNTPGEAVENALQAYAWELEIQVKHEDWQKNLRQ